MATMLKPGKNRLERPLTRAAFLAYLRESGLESLLVARDVMPCTCGDVNCKGWRLVEPREA